MLQFAPWAWWLQHGDSALSRITCSAVCGAGADQGFPLHPQLCRCPSKAMDHTGAHLVQPAWAGGVGLLEAGAQGVLMGHVCCGLSPRLRVVKRLWDF